MLVSIQELTDKGESVEKSSSLLEAYHLKDKAAMSSLDGGDKDETNKFYKDTEVIYFSFFSMDVHFAGIK